MIMTAALEVTLRTLKWIRRYKKIEEKNWSNEAYEIKET